MRVKLLLILLGTLIAAAPTVNAQDKLPLKVEGELKASDAKDRRLGSGPAQIRDIKMKEGTTYILELKSDVFDSYLRLEDANGKELAFDDDGGGGLNSRIVFKAPKDGTYKIVATSFDGKAGRYILEVNEGGQAAEMEAKIKSIVTAPAAERKKLLEEVVQYYNDKKDSIGVREAQRFYGVAFDLEDEGGAAAAEVYAAFSKLLLGSSNKEIAQIGQTFAGAARRLGLLGKEMEVRGTTVEGKPLDWKSYRGKVVLIDFWATWCGPCIAEMPNIRELYAKFRERGFEVIGISVDKNRGDLDKFLAKEQLPWTQVHDLPGEKGAPSMSDYYGVMAIPLPILVDRDGRIISMHARGEDLQRLLEKHLGEQKK